MNIQFVYGKIELEKLQNIDVLICPTDTSCSGSGGLDKAIHQAAGPELKTFLRGKRLSDGEVLITEAFNLGVKHIVHAAVPKSMPSDICAETLRNCYKNIIWTIGSPYTKTPCKTAAITLLGTSFCGWSYQQSMAALWSVILEYQREHGSSYFGKGTLEKLFIYYPSDAHNTIFGYQYRTSQAFFHAPDQWGQRGDPRLWYALMDHFDNPKFNGITLFDFIKEIQRFFHQKAGIWLCAETQVYIEEWDHGGMSGGGISSFMAEIGIPILCSNLCKLNFCNDKSPSFIIPVNLRCVHTKLYQLLLPYELLPELEHLRNNQYKMNSQKRIALDLEKLYFLTTYHYRNAPDLIDFYSLDVESANDSHFQFSEEASVRICEQLGFKPNAIGAALSTYLKKHGGPALESLIKKFATKEFHYD
jgi:O-acetyl-ADP-ribose deacetylase (regulator of RNase III)